MRIGALYIYPVKACAAVAVEDAALGPLGLEHDRRFAFVDAAGRALTQREHPLLATVRPELAAHWLRLDFGGLFEIVITLADFAASATVDVWSKPIAARAAPERLVAKAVDYFGTRLRLVALDAESQRAFCDSEPVLVTTGERLARLNAELRVAVGMERFRANVVLEAGEEGWSKLNGEHATLERAQPCGRCEVTTIDQASGARRGPEPLRTLNESFGGNFGVYCRVKRAGRLRRGEVLQAS
jgi:hypothetical protein